MPISAKAWISHPVLSQDCPKVLKNNFRSSSNPKDRVPAVSRAHLGGDFATALRCSADVDLHDVAYGRGVYVVVEDDGTILRSPRLRPDLAGRQSSRPSEASAYELRVDAVAGLTFRIEWSGDLKTWTSLGDFTSNGDGQVLEAPLPPESAQRLHRTVIGGP